MDDLNEDGTPKNPVPAAPDPIPEETVTLPKTEHDDLAHRADVSSQNFARAKKAEEKVDELQSRLDGLLNNPNPSGDNSEEIGKLRSDIADLRGKYAKTEVLQAHPQLKELWSDFETFRDDPENKGMNLKTAAKAFLTEKGVLSPKRDGLERPTGGPRTPIQQGMSVDDVKHLRETNYKKYSEMVRKGLIKV